jgi:hypothetical protein
MSGIQLSDEATPGKKAKEKAKKQYKSSTRETLFGCALKSNFFYFFFFH